MGQLQCPTNANRRSTSQQYYTRLSLVVVLAELVFFALYRELSAFRLVSPLLVAMLAVAVGLTVYTALEIVRNCGRLNLKLIFAMTTVIGIGLAMFSEQVSIAMRQRRMVEVVDQLGGHVRYDSHGSNDPFWLSTRSGWILPRWLIRVCGQDLFQDVWTISIADFSDAQISATSLAPLNDIQDMSVGAVKLSKQGTLELATKLGELDQLKQLVLYQANLSSECIAPLQELPNLQTLCFANCIIAPEAVTQLTRIEKLNFIRFDQCNLKLPDLKRLAGARKLKTIALYNSGLTDQEIGELQDALPDCEIWH